MIYIIQRELSYYRISFYLELKKHYQIRVLYSKHLLSSLWGNIVSTEKIFKHIKGIFPTSNPYFSFLETTLEIIRNRPDIIIHEMSLSILNVYFFPFLCRILKIKLIWWSHGYNRMDKKGIRKIRTSVRIFLHKLADTSIVYSEKGKKFLTSNGIKNEKVFVAWNSIDTEALCPRSIQPSNMRKERKVSFVFIGRLIDEKKPLFAAELFKRLSAKYPACTFHFIGGGEKETQLRDYFERKMNDKVFIHGEITSPQKISDILQQCDILVNPGYLGLNIVHALAFGIPVMSVDDGSDDIFHSPELEYIENTDAFIPISRLNIDEFENCCIKYIENVSLLKKARASAEECYKKISIENMLNGFIKAIEKVKIEYSK